MSENSDSVGLAKDVFCVLLVSGARWVEMAAEYGATDGVWLDPIPIVDGYWALDARTAILCSHPLYSPPSANTFKMISHL